MIIKSENVNQVHKALNKFDNNLRFTVAVDMFQNEVSHFLDLESSPDGITTFRLVSLLQLLISMWKHLKRTEFCYFGSSSAHQYYQNKLTIQEEQKSILTFT